MLHNDVLRRLRYALTINDTAAISIFKLADYDMDMAYLHAIMKKEEEEGYLPCRDKIITLFLDGLIIKNRGKQEGQKPGELAANARLSNNDLLRKIRIAMRYKDEDIIAILNLAQFRMSKSELSALFRKPDHRNYKPAGDQVVRNLLQGMVKKYRSGGKGASTSSVVASHSPATKSQRTAQGKSEGTARKKENTAPKKTDSPSNSVWGKV